MSNKMWGGRFTERPDAIMEEINVSIDVDRHMYAQDIAASKAHAAMLASRGIITASDAKNIARGLDTILAEIGKGDFDTKVRRAIEFLEDGDRVKVTVQFRGREVSHAYIGRDLLLRFGDLIKDHGTIERQPPLEGKSMFMTVASTHKPKVTADVKPAGELKTPPSEPRGDGATDSEAPAAAQPAAPSPAPEAPTTPAAGD